MSFEFRIVTMFPEVFDGFLDTSLIGRARRNCVLNIECIDLRQYAHDKHRSLDDTPYGGGAGMVMRPGPVMDMLDENQNAHRVLMSPKGTPFNQETAARFSGTTPLLLFCGRYEGIDQRARELFHEEISLGDFVLNGGEVAAMAVVEAVSRLVPGVIGNRNSIVEESFSSGMLEYPQYTRPEIIREKAVPNVLLSGDHRRIAKWRRGQALYRTAVKRPDLFEKLSLSDEDNTLLAEAEEADVFNFKGDSSET
jgi:tRNA (guanine37-N1)-methyltransferase